MQNLNDEPLWLRDKPQNRKLFMLLKEKTTFELISLVEQQKRREMGKTIFCRKSEKTMRCFQVARDALRGDTQKTIAWRHGISINTVQTHIRQVVMWVDLYKKLSGGG